MVTLFRARDKVDTKLNTLLIHSSEKALLSKYTALSEAAA
jgi:hypothetical protein